MRGKCKGVVVSSLIASKRASVTTYIIIGLVILIVGATAVYVFTQFEREEAALQADYISKLSDEVQEPLFFVDNCIRQTTRQGLDIIGQQGGWIDFHNPKVTGKTFQFGYFPTEYDGVSLTQDQDSLKLPYWYHMSSSSDCRSCSFSYNAPTLAQIESMLEFYIGENLQSCINNFDALKDKYEIVEEGDAQVDAQILAETLDVKVSYPLRIRLDESEFTHKDFPVSLDVNLRKIYDLASRITESEIRTAFLERYILNILSTATRADGNAMPPFAVQRFGSRQIFWSKFRVRDNLQGLIRDNLLYLTIPGTRNFFPLTLEEDESNKEIKQGYYYGASVINILGDETETEGPYDSVDVNFFYLDWPLYFEINPSQGAIIRPEQIAGDLAFLQIFSQSYDFFYDFSFPVYVDLRDNDAFNGDGYSFLFALEANVRNNLPFVQGDYVILPDITVASNLFADPKQRISGIITVNAKDDDNLPLANVDVNYNCGENIVFLGLTNEEGIFESRFPICLGGIVGLDKEGYFGARIPLDTEIAKDDELSGKLYQIVEKQSEMRVRDPELLVQLQNIDYGSLTFDQYRKLLEEGQKEINNSEALLTVTRIKDNPLDDEFTRFVFFNPQDKVQPLELIPGEYIVNIQYIDFEGVYIPETVREFKVPEKKTLGLTEDTERVTLPEINITPSPLGGGIIDEDIAGYWRVRKDDLESDKGIRFYSLVQSKPATHEELASLGDVRTLSTQYASLLQPQWINIE